MTETSVGRRWVVARVENPEEAGPLADFYPLRLNTLAISITNRIAGRRTAEVMALDYLRRRKIPASTKAWTISEIGKLRR